MRRVAAAVLAALAVGLTVYVLAPPQPETQDVAVLRTNIPAGTPIRADAVQVQPLPVDALPPDYIPSAEAAIGNIARIGLPQGTPLSEPLLLAPGVMDDAPAGCAVVAVELAREADALLAEPGRTVTLVGRDPNTGTPRGFSNVLVLGVVINDDSSPSVISATGDAKSTIAYVAVPDGEAILLGDALATAPVSVVLSP